MTDAGTTEIRFCTLAQIVDEINRRYEHAVIILEDQVLPNEVFFNGGIAACLGMTRVAQDLLAESLRESFGSLEQPEAESGEWDRDLDDDDGSV